MHHRVADGDIRIQQAGQRQQVVQIVVRARQVEDGPAEAAGEIVDLAGCRAALYGDNRRGSRQGGGEQLGGRISSTMAARASRGASRGSGR